MDVIIFFFSLEIKKLAAKFHQLQQDRKMYVDKGSPISSVGNDLNICNNIILYLTNDKKVSPFIQPLFILFLFEFS